MNCSKHYLFLSRSSRTSRWTSSLSFLYHIDSTLFARWYIVYPKTTFILHALLPINRHLPKLLQISLLNMCSVAIGCQNQLFWIEVLNSSYQLGRHCAKGWRLMLSYQLPSTPRLMVKQSKIIKILSAIFGYTARICRMMRQNYCQLQNLLTTIANRTLLESAHSSQIKSYIFKCHFLLLKLPDLLLGSAFNKRRQITLQIKWRKSWALWPKTPLSAGKEWQIKLIEGDLKLLTKKRIWHFYLTKISASSDQAKSLMTKLLVLFGYPRRSARFIV